MQRHITNAHKRGPLDIQGTPVCPSGLSTGRTGTGQDLNHRAKLRALAEAMGGPCFVRFDDGRTCVLSAQALQIVEIPLSHEVVQ